LTPLIVGTLLVLLALSYVFYPLFSDVASVETQPAAKEPVSSEAIEALREIEFDHATGKLSEPDYDALKSTYTQRAIDEMRAQDSRVCPKCGPRPENDAAFCSNCGTALG
jgi:hypothetical protein